MLHHHTVHACDGNRYRTITAALSCAVTLLLLVARDGTILRRCGRKTEPRDIARDIEEQLALEAAA